jgi:hypothetical protein
LKILGKNAEKLTQSVGYSQNSMYLKKRNQNFEEKKIRGNRNISQQALILRPNKFISICFLKE